MSIRPTHDEQQPLATIATWKRAFERGYAGTLCDAVTRTTSRPVPDRLYALIHRERVEAEVGRAA